MDEKIIDPVVEVLMAKAEELDREIDELTLVPRDELAQMQEDVAALTSKVSEQDETIAALQGEVETVKTVYADALSAMTGMEADLLAQKFSVEELRAMYEEKAEASEESESLAPLPAAQSGDMTEQDEEALASEEESAFTEEELAQVQDLQSKIERLSARPMWEYAAERAEKELQGVLAGREMPQF